MIEYKELPDDVCQLLIEELFRALPDLLPKVAPEGFSNSQLLYVYHPTPQRQYSEYRHSQLQLIKLKRRLKIPVDVEPTKSYEQFLKETELKPVDEQYELVSIYGNSLWNIFSNNHTVFDKKGNSYDLGSWRGSGGLIADVINQLQLVPNATFDYLDFYMGHYMDDERADLTAVYEFIFARLKHKELDWEFSFPRLGLVNFGNRDEATVAPEKYDPSAAMQQQLEQQEAKEATNELQQKFDEIHDEEFDKARYSKPSQVVMAYYNVYGKWPVGHPLGEG